MRRSRFDINHGELPSRQINAKTGQLVQILNPGDAGYEENAKIVAAALHPNGDRK
jgi:hypothetical protein